MRHRAVKEQEVLYVVFVDPDSHKPTLGYFECLELSGCTYVCVLRSHYVFINTQFYANSHLLVILSYTRTTTQLYANLPNDKLAYNWVLLI